MDVSILGLTRARDISQGSPNTPRQLSVNPNGDLLVAQSMAALAELVRQGESWSKLSDEVACVTAIPTTTAAHALWNGEPQGGKSYIIDSLGWQCVTSAAAASKFAMMVMIDNKFYTAQPSTADTAVAIASRSGRGAYTGRAKSSKTVTVVDNGWMSVGNSIETALTATGGAQLEAVLNGSLILQPQQLLCVAVVAVNTTATGKVSFRWSEQQMAIQG